RLLGLLLADHVGVEELEDLAGLGQVAHLHVGALGELLLDDLVAELDALVTDVDVGSCDELLDLLLALSAEIALEQVATVTDSCHELLPPVSPGREPGCPSHQTVPRAGPFAGPDTKHRRCHFRSCSGERRSALA